MLSRPHRGGDLRGELPIRAVALAISALLATVAMSGCDRSPEPAKGAVESEATRTGDSVLTAPEQRQLDAVVSDSRFKTRVCVPTIRVAMRDLVRARPLNVQVSDTAVAVFTACEDWQALSEHLRALHAVTPTDALRLRIARTEIDAQRYDLAIEVALPLAARPGASPDASWIAGVALFHAGRGSEARPHLEKAEPPRTATGDAEALELLGLIALDEGRLEDARRIFERASALAPTTVLARVGLGRTLARLGQGEAAAAQFAQARTLKDAVTNANARRMRLSGMSKQVQAAIDAGDIASAVRLLDEMLPIAEPDVRVQLEQFRAQLVRP